ncbi:HWE histidine kinase domain-containing protein [Paracraurococcus lichenis]|uniref:histidine kinase n=1 Tax=Paracraurococcus lichenis TaxID=3064888 RepID=A0ABT9DTF6_9PROT|nr:HWE histidine kinase domain-containing protein [Paracraurococcus sp. LOR1-02]MDO9707166.1 HWE histidine kinase domain-containing protein [Paracraurococcus sp. LOR1-02]
MRLSRLLLVGALLLPLALVLLGRLLPDHAGRAAGLQHEAAAAADRIASLVPASPQASLSDPEASPATAAALRDAPWRAAPTPAALAAALLGPSPPPGIRLALLASDGRVLARSAEEAIPANQPLLCARSPVPGWPAMVIAMRDMATPGGNGLLSLGSAVGGMLLLAGLAHRWERRARDAAAAEDVREEQRNASFAESATRLRLALGAAELGSWSWEEATDEVTWDDRAAAILRWHPSHAVPRGAIRQRLEPEDHPTLDAAFARARWDREPCQCTLRLRASAGQPLRWIELRAQAARGPRGIVWHGVVGDITERREAEEQQQRLLREVDHRAKNTLAVVQALLRLTRTEDPVDFLPRVEARIAALARAHTLLAQSRWQGTSLRHLAAAELHRHRPRDGAAQPLLSGPAVMLAAIATQPMAMVLHELASNAARHGALAQAGGMLSVTWWLDPAGGLELLWQERQPAPPPAPPQDGFGMRILEATVRDQLGGRLTRDWGPEGLRCAIHLPPGCVVATPPAAAAA